MVNKDKTFPVVSVCAEDILMMLEDNDASAKEMKEAELIISRMRDRDMEEIAMALSDIMIDEGYWNILRIKF